MTALIALMPPFNRWFLEYWFRPEVTRLISVSKSRIPQFVFLSSVVGEDIAHPPADDGYTGRRAASLLEDTAWTPPIFGSSIHGHDGDHEEGDVPRPSGQEFVLSRREPAESLTEEWLRRMLFPAHHGKVIILRVAHDRHEPNLEDARACIYRLGSTTSIRRAVVWDVSRGPIDHHAFDRAWDHVGGCPEYSVVPITNTP